MTLNVIRVTHPSEERTELSFGASLIGSTNAFIIVPRKAVILAEGCHMVLCKVNCMHPNVSFASTSSSHRTCALVRPYSPNLLGMTASLANAGTQLRHN
eukprot:3621069-Amphidinium_carterae.1